MVASETALVDSFFERIPFTEILAIAHPEWLGICRSSHEMFENHLYVRENIDQIAASRFGKEIAHKVQKAVVFQSFAPGWEKLLVAIHKYAPDLPIYCIWHGSFLQSNEETNWTAFKLIHDYYKRGLLRRVGFVKEGMAEIMASTGMDACFILNRVNKIPDSPSQLLDQKPCDCAIWASSWNWRKPPFAMLVAAATLPDIRTHLHGANKYTDDFIREFDLDIEIHKKSVPPGLMNAELGRMHINLYVTLSECAPMLPLESLAAGVPCLLGPNNHYFRDDKFLFDALVVPFPDSATVIKRFIVAALDARNEIIDAYKKYAITYNEKSRDSVIKFFDCS